MKPDGMDAIQGRIRDIMQRFGPSNPTPAVQKSLPSPASLQESSKGPTSDRKALSPFGKELMERIQERDASLPGASLRESNTGERENLQKVLLSGQRSSLSPLARLPRELSGLSMEKSGLSPGVERLVEERSRAHGVSPRLVKAMILAESGGDTQARSPAGARGLMQLMPATAEMLQVDPHNPRENLDGGIQYLKMLAQKFKSLDEILAAYNSGPGSVRKYGGVPPFEETRNYIKKIRNHLARIED